MSQAQVTWNKSSILPEDILDILSLLNALCTLNLRPMSEGRDELTAILVTIILQLQNCAPGSNMETEKPLLEATVYIFIGKKSIFFITLSDNCTGNPLLWTPWRQDSLIFGQLLTLLRIVLELRLKSFTGLVKKAAQNCTLNFYFLYFHEKPKRADVFLTEQQKFVVSNLELCCLIMSHTEAALEEMR